MIRSATRSHSKYRLTTWLTAALAVAGASLVPAASAAAAPADTSDNKLVIIQHNTDKKGYGEAVAQAVQHGADAITLQELCESDAKYLRTPDGGGWNVLWRVQVNSPESNCPGVVVNGVTRQAKGVAILSKHRFGEDRTENLYSYDPAPVDDPLREYKLICQQLLGTGVEKSWVCTTHLALGYDEMDGSAFRQRQITKITNLLDPWVTDGRRVVLTGDFNAEPDTANLAALYRVTAGGTDSDKFWEGDQNDPNFCPNGPCQNMQNTTDPKRDANGDIVRPGRELDYFLVSHRRVNPRDGLKKEVTPSTTSGHHIIRGEVVFQPF
ncbi:endonuclease/exonuclease/phosphatase family metal-dependent hydrolase [Kineococcus xinjiangensis]|uniref:Endonuclease/exonuclease/phosphatase family metal-dependent hydrolase n=1 Tax=Kineococcus xinjiangensis TaxID=512762 RepID=A0A2S6IDB2_9ACTN|nr:endonuclease/exonuclease/phosphatase family protein [Kineococcus xinjiangensis]PPK92205.1 endonuclease/exonuclease/phosphatase family metal-dependent hydrolase [Kineococcus xinjiangensis]